MADKSVGELIAATSVTPTDLFVLEQNGTAKKLTGQILENWLVSLADGHGGIQSIVKLSTSGLVDTYRITLADTTTFDFMVTNGKSIKSISKASTSGLVDTYRITFNDSTSSTFTVTNGEKGDKGDTAYIWIKYASQEPTVNSNSFGDVPDDWIGVYFGFSSSAPTDWKQYKWYRIKGEKGDTGDPASLVRSSVNYQVGDSGTIIPSGSWSESIPPVPQGKYLWTKEVTQFNTGNPITKYSVSRFGIDGSGSVSTVAGVSPNADGNVPLTAADVKALPIPGGTMEGPINMNGQPLFGLNAPTEDDEAATKGSSESYTNTQITDRVIYGKGKNLLKNTAKSQTINGVTFTVNEDGSVTVKGEAAKSTVLTLNRLNYAEFVGKKLSGALVDEPVSLLVSYLSSGGGWLSEKYEWGAGLTIPEVDGAAYIEIGVFVNNGNVVDNKTIYPMIRLASETDDTYEPYYKGLKELADSGMKLVWENPSPASEYAAKTIPINDNGYDVVWVEFSTMGGSVTTNAICRKGTTAVASVSITALYYRNFTFNSGNVEFQDCKYNTNYNDWGMTVANTSCIPWRIYGIKGVFA